jgi:hypothetical protein
VKKLFATRMAPATDVEWQSRKIIATFTTCRVTLPDELGEGLVRPRADSTDEEPCEGVYKSK